MSRLYIHLALIRYWNDNPTDRDIPFIGLDAVAQERVLVIANMIMLDDERRRLKRVLDYSPAVR